MKTLQELVNDEDPALPLVMEWLDQASNDVRVLPCEPDLGDQTLLDLQVTTRSPMGAIAHRTGGLLIDEGWVRVLGASSDALPRSITTWNGMREERAPRLDGAVRVGDDAVGGFFAISGGGIAVPSGNEGYYAPDTLCWEDTGARYSQWLRWLFQGDLEVFYGNARWPEWREETRKLRGDQGFHVYPPLFARGPAVGERSRKAVPLDELWILYVETLPAQLARSADE